MDAEATVEGAELGSAQSDSIPPAAVWKSLTEAQQEHVYQGVARVCRERLRGEQSDERV